MPTACGWYLCRGEFQTSIFPKLIWISWRSIKDIEEEVDGIWLRRTRVTRRLTEWKFRINVPWNPWEHLSLASASRLRPDNNPNFNFPEDAFDLHSVETRTYVRSSMCIYVGCSRKFASKNLQKLLRAFKYFYELLNINFLYPDKFV